MRTWGDCYGYLLVATGRAEVMVDPIMNLWDAAAVCRSWKKRAEPSPIGRGPRRSRAATAWPPTATS